MEKIFETIEVALALKGFKLLDGDKESVIIRNPEKDKDYEIRVTEIE